MTARVRTAAQWAGLVALSALLVGGLEFFRLPAALLLGSLAAAAVLSGLDVEMRLPAPLFMGAQAIVGCLIARAVQPSTLGAVARDWPLFFIGVFSVIAVSAGLGWLCSRGCGFFPGRQRCGALFPARRP